MSTSNLALMIGKTLSFDEEINSIRQLKGESHVQVSCDYEVRLSTVDTQKLRL